MLRTRVGSRPLSIQVSAWRPDSGPGGIGVVAPAVGPDQSSRVYEQVHGSREELTYRAVLRSLELAEEVGARRVRILCPDESVTRQINREEPVPQGGRLPLLYIRVKAMMYTFERAEIAAVPEGRVRAAQRLAQAASRIPPRIKRPEPQTLLPMDLTPAA